MLSPAAHAVANTPVGSIASTSGATSIYPGVLNQPAGDWTTGVLPAVETSTASDLWTMLIEIDDSAVDANCATAGHAVGFSGTPVVTNLTTGSPVAFTASLGSTAGGCTTGKVKDALLLTSTHGGPAGAVLKISGIKYNVGASAAIGPVRYAINQTDNPPLTASFQTANSNATISAVRASSADPVNLVPPSKDSAIPNIVVQETRAGAITTGGVCITLDTPPTGTSFTAGTLGVTSSGGTGKGTSTGAAVLSGTTVAFTASLSTAATTYTISGLKLTTGLATGPVNADVTAAVVTAGVVTSCPQLIAYAPNIRLSTVGSVDRVAGANRYATAAAIAADFGDLGGKTVVIARGDNFPDALAASYLAGQNDVPILLTTPTSVPAETLQAIAFGGVTDVVLVGGTTAISSSVESYLDNFHTYDPGSSVATDQPNAGTLTVTRIGGADRYATAALVAEAPGLDKAGTVGLADGGTCDNDVATAIVASGENFPDALAAGGLAYHGVEGCGSGPLPLLLTPAASVSPATAIAIRDLGIKKVILMGGSAAVSDSVASGLDSLSGVSVVRVGGTTRQDTAVKLATLVLGSDAIGDWDSGAFLVARPDTFPDALAASSLSGGSLAPLYLAASPTELGTDAINGIVGYPVQYGQGTLIGGTAALSDHVLGQTEDAIASQ